jgi:hypothetical protein
VPQTDLVSLTSRVIAASGSHDAFSQLIQCELPILIQAAAREDGAPISGGYRQMMLD